MNTGNWRIAMISEIVLSISLVITLGLLVLMQYLHAKERKDLIRAIIAKNMDQINTAEAIDKRPKETEEKQSDLIPLNADTPDDLFDKMIKKMNANN